LSSAGRPLAAAFWPQSAGAAARLSAPSHQCRDRDAAPPRRNCHLSRSGV